MGTRVPPHRAMNRADALAHLLNDPVDHTKRVAEPHSPYVIQSGSRWVNPSVDHTKRDPEPHSPYVIQSGSRWVGTNKSETSTLDRINANNARQNALAHLMRNNHLQNSSHSFKRGHVQQDRHDALDSLTGSQVSREAIQQSWQSGWTPQSSKVPTGDYSSDALELAMSVLARGDPEKDDAHCASEAVSSPAILDPSYQGADKHAVAVINDGSPQHTSVLGEKGFDRPHIVDKTTIASELSHDYLGRWTGIEGVTADGQIYDKPII